jgi:PAS domain S-box-containing protein
MTSTAGGLAVGGDVEQALTDLPVPSYVLDTTGIVRWLNPAAERLLGDVRGRHFTSIVGAQDKTKAQELFTRKVLGTTAATETTGVFVSTDGASVTLEVSAVPLMGGERVVGVFGLLTGPLDGETRTAPAHLTPRQAEVLRHLEQGHSTKQIAQELNVSNETVRNHVRHLLRALGVTTRLEAVAAVRHGRALGVSAQEPALRPESGPAGSRAGLGSS